MSKDAEQIAGALVRMDPDFLPHTYGIMVPEDRTDRDGMLEATRELILQGVRRPAQIARYLRVSTALAATLVNEVDAAYKTVMQSLDPEVARARAAEAAAQLQARAMQIYHESMDSGSKLAALKTALAAQKLETEVLRLTGQRQGNTSITVDNRDQRAVVQMQLEDLNVPTDMLDTLADQITAAASAKLKGGPKR